MALTRLVLDTRKNSRKMDNTYPISLRVFHKKTRIVALDYSTSIGGWDEKNHRLKKSAIANKNLNCLEINEDIDDKLQIAKAIIKNFGVDIKKINVDQLVNRIKAGWDAKIISTERRSVNDCIQLLKWTSILVKRKERANSPSTAEWYANSVSAFLRFNGIEDIKLDDISVSHFKEFLVEAKAKNVKSSSINSYLRGIRAIYNKALDEDKFVLVKNPFDKFKIPSSQKTKKRATSKESFLQIRKLKYSEECALWHTKNYILIMFNCRGMNLIDLVKLKVENIQGERLYYGRSKTGDPLSVKITKELARILSYYSKNKSNRDFLFPSYYDGSTQSYEKYKSIRRRINERFKKIAKDAGITENFTTYSIRHSWATIAKHMGISTEIISEGLGHNSLRTTEIYLKSFENHTIDDANEKIVS